MSEFNREATIKELDPNKMKCQIGLCNDYFAMK